MIKVPIKFTGNAFNGNYSAIVSQELRSAMQESVLILESEVAQETPVNFGTLRAGIRGEVQTPFMGTVGVVGPGERYYKFVEDGRRPGKFPPMKAIILWVRRKLKPHVLARSIKTRRITKQLRGDAQLSALERVSFLVARKIAEKGTTGAKMFAKGVKAKTPQILRRFQIASNNIGRRLS